MEIQVRPAGNREEFARGARVIGQYFGMPPLEGDAAERMMRRLPMDRLYVAFDGANAVGSAGAYPFTLTVPGRRLSCAGVTIVGVAPTHRRRGVLTGLMRRLIDDAHHRGDPISALWASEESIYGRYGYGIASWVAEITVPKERAVFTQPFSPRGRFSIVSPAEAHPLCARIWDRLSEQRAGLFSRTEPWWRERVLVDPPERGTPGAPKRIAILELDGEPRGYAIYRHRTRFDEAIISSDLDVVEALATDREAMRELWRWLLDMDLATRIIAHRLPLDHALLQLATYPRHLHVRLSDALWMRLVDVGAALSGRSYAQPGTVVFEVRDPFCPWNEGRWRLRDGHAERTDAAADLSLGVDALGAAYLGGVTFRALADAFRVDELSPGALERADALFRTATQPWCPEIF